VRSAWIKLRGADGGSAEVNLREAVSIEAHGTGTRLTFPDGCRFYLDESPAAMRRLQKMLLRSMQINAEREGAAVASARYYPRAFFR
jgi:hypothetical protein